MNRSAATRKNQLWRRIVAGKQLLCCGAANGPAAVGNRDVGLIGEAGERRFRVLRAKQQIGRRVRRAIFYADGQRLLGKVAERLLDHVADAIDGQYKTFEGA